MNANTKRMLAIAGTLLVCGVMIVSWTIFRSVPWLVLDGGAIADAMEQSATESYHAALASGDATVQLQILEEQFAPLIRQDDDGAAWIRDEFSDDLSALVDSADPGVSNAASRVLSLLDGEPGLPDDG